MTCDDILRRLEAACDPKWKAMNAKNGAPENQFGVKMGDVRAIAKEAKTDHDRALQLWKTGNLEARLVATLTIKPKQLSETELEDMVRDVTFGQLADWTMTNVVKQHPAKERLRTKWIGSSHPSLARAAWSLTCERITKAPDGLDLTSLLDTIEKDMATAPSLAQWTMNFALIDIGVEHPELRDRAIAIGESLGLYRDYPTSKGCTSPFAPIAIRELAGRR
ncbi:MAG: DNA alkylation repair protein [Armatimonadetes bacterium]|nr:DNA alkylation repair protein [Armatimonadota bacterium]